MRCTTWRELERADMDTVAAHAAEMENRAGQDSGQTGELLPCPFCGGKQTYRKHDGGVWLTTTNHKRGCIMREALSFVAFDTEAEAIEAWNSRAELTCEMRADGAHCMNGVEFYECRSCGEYACIPTVMGKSEPPSYCPNCGAKVVE